MIFYKQGHKILCTNFSYIRTEGIVRKIGVLLDKECCDMAYFFVQGIVYSLDKGYS